MKLIKNQVNFYNLKIFYFVNESHICLTNNENKGIFIIFKLPLFFYLYFYYNGVTLQSQTPAFENLPVKECPLYPMISSTVSQSIMRLEFACENLPSLQEICRSQVLNDSKNQSIDNLIGQLPQQLIDYLKK